MVRAAIEHVPAVDAVELAITPTDEQAATSVNGLVRPASMRMPAAITNVRSPTTAMEQDTTANELVTYTAHEQVTTAYGLVQVTTTAKMRVDSVRKQVTAVDGLDTATSFPTVLPDAEDKAQGMSAAPIMGTTSAVLSDLVSSGPLGCRSISDNYHC